MAHKLFIFITVMTLSFTVFAQEELPCGPFDVNCNEGPPEEEIPVDGGITFLSIAGIAFGIKKIKRII